MMWADGPGRRDDDQRERVATLTGHRGSRTLDTFTLVVNWGDALSPNNVETYTFPASGSGSQTFSLTHQYLDDNPSGSASDTYTISRHGY
ncbi:MAG: hypothetical protein R3C99_06780 [Pirellulaceae bacterium]